MRRIFILEKVENIGNDTFRDTIAVSHETAKLIRIVMESTYPAPRGKWESKDSITWIKIGAELEYRITEYFIL
jgi:hypothetical protein